MKNLATSLIGGFINVTAVLFPKWNAEYSFNLLCKVKRVPLTDEGRRFLEMGQTVYLDIEGHSAALHTWGSGTRNVLFLHGWMSNSQRWAPYLDQLDLDEYKIHALDAPGHGLAKGNYLNLEIYRQAFIQSLERIGEVDTLVCHSLGGLIGSYGYLHDRKLAVRQFVLMGSPSGMDAIFAYFENLIGLSDAALKNLEGKVNSVLQLPHNEISISHFLSKVERPVLVIHDQADRIAPFESIRKASELARHRASAQENNKNNFTTYFTKGENHSMQSPETIERVIQYIKK